MNEHAKFAADALQIANFGTNVPDEEVLRLAALAQAHATLALVEVGERQAAALERIADRLEAEGVDDSLTKIRYERDAR